MRKLEIEGLLGLLRFKRYSNVHALKSSDYTNKTPIQKQLLEIIFKITKYPGKETRTNISILANLNIRKTQVSFQNLRSKHNQTSKGAKEIQNAEKQVEIDVEALFSIYTDIREGKPVRIKNKNDLTNFIKNNKI